MQTTEVREVVVIVFSMLFVRDVSAFVDPVGNDIYWKFRVEPLVSQDALRFRVSLDHGASSALHAASERIPTTPPQRQSPTAWSGNCPSSQSFDFHLKIRAPESFDAVDDVFSGTAWTLFCGD